MRTAREIETKRRIDVAVWAYAYEIKDDPLVDDFVFDSEALLVSLSVSTDRPEMDAWFRENFDPSTGMWVRNHPDLKGLHRIYLIKKGKLMKDMPITSLIPITGLIDRAFKRPVMRIKPKSTKRPDLDAALKSLLDQVQEEVIETIASQVAEKVGEALEGHILMDGEHADSESKDEWEAAVDDLVEQAIEEYVPVLSQDWLGQNTIGAGLHLPDGVKKFAMSLGKEYYKQITYKQSPTQILSRAGIETEHVEAALKLHNNPTEQEIKNMADQTDDDLQVVIEKIAEHIGKDPSDTMAVYDDIDLASEDDAILAEGAAPRLGIGAKEINILQLGKLVHGTDLMDMVLQGVEAYWTNKGKRGPRKPAADKKAKPPKAPKLPAPVSTDETEGNITVTTLVALKECGASDIEMAKNLGVSRATYNNYVNGKTDFNPSDDQMSFVRGEVVDRINKLHEALAEIDGVEPETVF